MLEGIIDNIAKFHDFDLGHEIIYISECNDVFNVRVLHMWLNRMKHHFAKQMKDESVADRI